MKYEIKDLLGSNIICLYKKLDVVSVSRDALRGMLEGANPVIQDAGEIIQMTYPGTSLSCQFVEPENRLQVSEASNQKPNTSHAVEVISKAHRLASSSKLIAYGFNFDLLIAFPEGDPAKYLMEKFLKDPATLEKNLGITLVGHGLNLKFHRDQFIHSISLKTGTFSNRDDTIDEEIHAVVAHFNTHFDATELPDLSEMKEQFEAQYEYLSEFIHELL